MRIKNFSDRIDHHYGSNHPAFVIAGKEYWMHPSTNLHRDGIWITDDREFTRSHGDAKGTGTHIWRIDCEWKDNLLKWYRCKKGAGSNGDFIYTDTMRNQNYKTLHQFMDYLFKGGRAERLNELNIKN